MKTFKITVSVLLYLLATVQVGFAQDDVQKKLMLSQIDSIVSEYKTYSSFTEDLDNISETYIANFENLFDPNAMLFTDIAESEFEIASLNVKSYTQFARQHFSIGFDVDTVEFSYLTIEKNSDKKIKEKYVVKVPIKKSFFGYFNDSTYIERKPELILVFGADKNYKLNPKIQQIAIANSQITKNNTKQKKLLETSKKDNETKLKSFDSQISLIQKQIDHLQQKADSLQNLKNKLSDKAVNQKIQQIDAHNEEVKKLIEKEKKAIKILKTQYLKSAKFKP